jgi:hypothetical protein
VCGTVCVHTLFHLYIFIHFHILYGYICAHTYMHLHMRTHSLEGERVFTRREPANTWGATHNENPQTAPRPPRADTVTDFQHQPPAIFALIAPVSPRACFPLNVTLLRFSLAAGNVDGFHSRGTLRCSSSRRSHGEECGLWVSLDIANGW